MIVHAYGGLCNRLRVILSYRAVYGEIGVVWLKDEEIAFAHFLDVFGPLARVTWHDNPAEAEVRTLGAHRDAPSSALLDYRELRPKEDPDFDNRIRSTRPYSAVHIRRTDHVGLARAAGNYTDDEQFREWIAATPQPRVFVATDNEETQERFAHYVVTVGKVPICSPIQTSKYQRQTDLAHSVRDLFACAGAADFMGSGESSFSATIEMLRRIGGWWT